MDQPHRINTAVMATSVAVDIVTVTTTTAIIADNRAIVDSLHRTEEVGTRLELEAAAAVATDQYAIFYSGSMSSDHRALIDDHFTLG